MTGRIVNRLINIGFGNVMSAGKIVVALSPDSAPVKRMISEAKSEGTLVDATYGRKTRAVILADSGHVILSPVTPETIAARLDSKENLNE